MYQYKNWRPWRYATSSDTLLTSYEPSAFPAYVAGKPPDLGLGATGAVIQVKEVSVVMLRCYGTDAANKVGRIRISGWMENGPGMVLLDANPVLGAHSFSNEPPISVSYGKSRWPSNATLYEVDFWDIDENACRAYTDRNEENGTSYLVMQTMQFRYLVCEMALTSVVTMGVIWRELAA